MSLSENTSKIEQLLAAISALPEAGSGGEQATPQITVSSSGLITATAGDKSATKQLSTQAAQTITPGTSNKTISSGKYLTGTQTILGDADLVAGNIKKGVTIFDVLGTYEGESSGGGGLPSGISKLASDTVTPTDNVVYQDIKHGLGVAPNFLIWFVENDVGTTGVASLATDGSLTIKRVKMNTSSSTVYNVHYVTHGYNASTQFGQTAGKYSNSTDMTATIARMRTASPYYFKSGYTYRWICGVADGVL